jgi:hypothetical protein
MPRTIIAAEQLTTPANRFPASVFRLSTSSKTSPRAPGAFRGRPHDETRQAYLPLTTLSRMMMISHYCQHTQPLARMRDDMGTTPTKST